jgi:hypothetical protein
MCHKTCFGKHQRVDYNYVAMLELLGVELAVITTIRIDVKVNKTAPFQKMGQGCIYTSL